MPVKKTFIGFIIVLCYACQPSGPVHDPLPILGNAIIDTVFKDGETIIDTIYPEIPDFSLTDQMGNTLTKANLEGKIYVADFIFTTCTGICPIMTTNMEEVHQTFKDDSMICIVSHTVNPDGDSVPVLRAYAATHHATYPNWYFTTGDKKLIYDLARNNYLVSATEGNGGAEDFVHSQYFALVDPNKHVRGLYDGTDSAQVIKLIADIKVLKNVFR
jgi:protein SCO1/2